MILYVLCLNWAGLRHAAEQYKLNVGGFRWGTADTVDFVGSANSYLLVKNINMRRSNTVTVPSYGGAGIWHLAVHQFVGGK